MKNFSELTLGALPQTMETVQFRVFAPNVNSVMLLLKKNNEMQTVALSKKSRGYFEVITEACCGDQYYYLLDNQLKRADPASKFQPQGIFGPSEIVALKYPKKYWTNLPLNEYIIYELHVGLFSPTQNFSGIIPHLPYLKKLGITAVELMPINQFPGKRNWGYDGVFPFAVQASYGGPYQLQQFIEVCHRHQIAVILDVVYNHFGPEGNYIDDFGPYYSSTYQAPWGKAINFDGAYSNEVRQFFIENALYWFLYFDVDGLRLDALHAIYDQSAYPFLRELADKVKALSHKIGKPLYLIAESDLNDPQLIHPQRLGGYGLNAQWNDDFHHALHRLLTQEKEHYYQDFGRVKQFAHAYRGNYVYEGQYSQFRKKNHGIKSNLISPQQMVTFIQNHDQIGNRLHGDRLSNLISLEQLKLAAALLLLSPSIPLLFMGEEYGELNPFLYFINHHDKALIKRVLAGRKKEFPQMKAADAKINIADQWSFNRCRLNWNLLKIKKHASLLHFYQTLIKIRKQEKLNQLNKKNIKIKFNELPPIIKISYQIKSKSLIAYANFSNERISINPPKGKLLINSLADTHSSLTDKLLHPFQFILIKNREFHD